MSRDAASSGVFTNVLCASCLALLAILSPAVAIEIATKDITPETADRDIASESKRQPVVVYFWSPDCEPCTRAELLLQRVLSSATLTTKFRRIDWKAHGDAMKELIAVPQLPLAIAVVNGQRVPETVGGDFSESDVTDFLAAIAKRRWQINNPDSPYMPTVPTGTVEPETIAIAPDKSDYFGRKDSIAIREKPGDGAAVVGRLQQGERVKMTARTTDESSPEDRWYQMSLPDGKAGFVKGKDLLSEDSQAQKVKYQKLAARFNDLLDNVRVSRGKLARYMGIYTGGQDCVLSPSQHKRIESFDGAVSASQRLRDILWASNTAILWTDGSYVYRTNLVWPGVAKYTVKKTETKKFSRDTIELVELAPADPLAPDADWSTTGFTQEGKLLFRIKREGTKITYAPMTRCEDPAAAREAIQYFYANVINKLPVEDPSPKRSKSE